MPTWSDDDLARELGEALREADEVTERSREAAYAAFAWRTVDSDLLALTHDSSTAAEPAARGGEAAGPRVVSFQGGGLALELELEDGRLLGQIVPATAGRVTLIPRTGPPRAVDTDPAGFFSFDDVGAGPVRFRVELQGPTRATGWLTL